MTWAAPAGNKSAWMAVVLGSTGSNLGKPERLAEAPTDPGLVAVREAADGGFVLLWTQPSEGGDVLRIAHLNRQGRLLGSPTDAAVASHPILWIDAVPTGSDTLIIWAEQGDGEGALSTRPLDEHDRFAGPGRRVLDGALAWQAIRIPGGVALASVRRSKAPGRGTVGLSFLDRAGVPTTDPIVVSDAPTARPDIDAAAVGGQILLAWSDERDLNSAVYLAGLDRRGNLVRQPARVTRGLGPEALVQLVSGADRAYLVWEPLGERQPEGRTLNLGAINQQLELGEARAMLRVDSETELPELKATKRGLHALTLARACERARGDCAGKDALPFFVELSPDLVPRVAEPLQLSVDGGRSATAAWGLSCTDEDCVALASLADVPTPVYSVNLEHVSDTWRSPATRAKAAQPPFAVSLRSIASTDPLSDLALADFGESKLLAWVTYFDPSLPYERPAKPAPDGRWAPVRALLQVARVEGEALAAPTTISYRARSPGGIALSPSTERAEALLAWSAVDEGRAQVFLTLLGEQGQRQAQGMFTHAATEVADLALTYVGDGWVVGWIDERDGDPEVYVAKVDRTLKRQGDEQRLTKAPGVATGVELIQNGEEVLVVWADARDPAKPGVSDVYAARIGARDAKPMGEPHRLASSPSHSHSPALARSGPRVLAAWLEESVRNGEAGAIAIAELDEQGRIVAPPDRVETPGGTPTTLALDCTDGRCRVVVSVDVGERAVLQAFSWTPGQPADVRQLSTLQGAGGQAMSLALLGPSLLYSEQPTREEGRVQLMTVEW